MSHAALQRLVVRLCYDPALADRIAAGGADLAGITEVERSWLAAVDRRAFSIDPLRRTRSLHALLLEFPASSTVAAAVSGDVRELDAFFSSARFHRTIEEGASLAAGFASYLEEMAPADPRLPPLARLEGAMAAMRRAPAPSPGTGPRVALSPWARIVRLPAGALGLMQQVMGWLAARGPDLVATLVAGPPQRGAMPTFAGSEREAVLLQRQGEGDINATIVSDELASVLDAAAPGADRADLRRAVAAHGLDAAEADEVLQGLVDDGVLVPGAPAQAARLP